MDQAYRLPDVHAIGMSAPIGWLVGGWRDLWRAPVAFLAYGLVVAATSAAIVLGLVFTGMGLWSLILAAGFALLAPIVAMGVYEGGRLIERGERPGLRSIAFVRQAFRRDVVFLGLGLLFAFGIWVELARVNYGIATNRLHETLDAFVQFALTTGAGVSMLIWGTVLGGILAWLTFAFVVVSAPMLLDSRSDVFVATVTSVRCVVKNTGPMLLWAAIIAAMLLVSAATFFLGLVIVIPWLGLASWRAYRTLVASENKP
ncbi:MAG: hypothetical protein RIR33_2323 [Pseudomonadota bacterium]